MNIGHIFSGYDLNSGLPFSWTDHQEDGMNQGQTVFSQLMDHIPQHMFERCVDHYRGNFRTKSFSCRDQYYCMAFAQLTWRDSLRDIELCLRTAGRKRYHLGIRGHVSRNTLAHANAHRGWRIYEALALELIRVARQLYAGDDFCRDLDTMAYELDSTTIDLCLSLFPWAEFRKAKSALKLHTQLDLRGNIPTMIRITPGRVHDVRFLDRIAAEPGVIYIMDRGFLDFGRLYRFHQNATHFVIRDKTNLKCRRVCSHTTDRTCGVICDQPVRLTDQRTAILYPDHLRRIRFHDQDTKRQLIFLSITSISRHGALLSSTRDAGRWSSSSNGSNSTCGSRSSMVTTKMPSRPRSGLPIRSMCWWPSLKNI